MQPPAFSLLIAQSRWMRAYVLTLHVMLILTVIFLPVSFIVKWLALIAVLAHWRYSQLRYLTVSNDHWVGRIDYKNQRWLLTGSVYQTRTWLKQATVWRWLIVLNFYGDHNHRHYAVILWPDSADQDSLRRLRACLRHMPVFGKTQ